MNAVRKRAWATRRRKYGPRGHRGSYWRRPASVHGAIAEIVKLLRDGVLSEGQAVRATGLDRIEVRRLADGDGLPADASATGKNPPAG